MKKRQINYDKFTTRMRKPEYCGVFDDLLAFTGLSEKAACRLILGSGLRSRREMKFVSPKGKVENELFYRCCREYLFLNAFRPVQDVLVSAHKDGLLDGPALDFGAGMGNDSVWLSKRHDVSYHEIGIVQREFMKFRVERNGMDRIEVLYPYVGGKYDPLGCVERKYGTIVLRDVLEHIPDYQDVMRRLAGHLKPGGTLVEHTPWNFKDEKGNWVHYSVLHCEETMPLKELMGELGIKLVRKGIWRKDG